jgi:hypothetical protein
VYFEPSLLPFLENILGGRHVNFCPLEDVFSADIPCPAFIVISGTTDFFSKLQRVIRDRSTVIWIMQQSFFGVKPRYFQNQVNQAASLSRSVGFILSSSFIGCMVEPQMLSILFHLALHLVFRTENLSIH